MGSPRWLALVCLLALATPLGRPAAASPYDDWKGLTRAEQWLALRYFWQLPDVRSSQQLAVRESTARYPQLSGQHDPRDAYRHALWNGAMTSRLRSREAAARWANAHEAKPNNPPVSEAMDLANNRTARELTWAARTPGRAWWRRTRFPDDAWVVTRMQRAVDGGELLMIEEQGGVRDPQAGRLVPTRAP